MSSLRLLPVSWTFSALMTTMLSPQSMCGVYEGLCLPRRRIAMIEASRPSTKPSASISNHFLSISEGLAEKVFIARSTAHRQADLGPVRESRSCKRSVAHGQAELLDVGLPAVQHEDDAGKGERAMTAMPSMTMNAPVLLEEHD